MPNKTSIEWADYTSNPIHVVRQSDGKRGWHCVRVSKGCQNCYAATLNKRWGTGLDYVMKNNLVVDWVLNTRELEALRKLPAGSRVFLGDMLDLFHELIPLPMLVAVLNTLAECKHLVPMILTKRAERMCRVLTAYISAHGEEALAHVWKGVSAEDQPAADERLPWLTALPGVNFVSYEPGLGPVDFTPWLGSLECCHVCGVPKSRTHSRPGDETGQDWPYCMNADCIAFQEPMASAAFRRRLHWIITGGESGGGARPYNPDWARSVVAQCRANGAAPFVKQLGTVWARQHGADYKGGDMSFWSEDLRVREFPA